MDFQGSAADWAKLMIELDAGWSLMVGQKIRLEEQVMEVQGQEGRIKDKYLKLKGNHVAMKENFDSEKMKWREERVQIKDEYWQLELEKKILDIDLKAAMSQKKGDDAALIQKIQVLEREKEQLVAEVSKLQKEKSDEAKKRLEEVKAKKRELMKSIGAVERVTNAIESGVCKFNMGSEEFKKILKENRAFEEESKKLAVVLIKRNEALEKENKELEEKLSRANTEEDTETGRICKKRRALKEGREIMILERDGAIQELYEENKTLEAQKKELQPNSTSLKRGQGAQNQAL